MLECSVVVCLFGALKKKAKTALKSYHMRVQVERIKSPFSPPKDMHARGWKPGSVLRPSTEQENLTGTKCACLITQLCP